MQIYIKSCHEGSKIPEWSIIELQGELEANQRSVLQGALIGDLHYNKDGEPLLIIGHHVLVGKVSKFERPFAILEQVHGKEGEEDFFQVQGIVRRKLIFSDRPRPIVVHSAEAENP